MSNALLQTYALYPIEIVKGEGSSVWDKSDKKYLDFYGGHAVCIIGHSPKHVVKAIHEQSKQLMFYSNIFHTQPSHKLAEKLAETLLPEKYQVYFTNSGSEANETALKIARKHTGKTHVISFNGAFHGRAITSIGATGIEKYHQFEPNLDEYTQFAEIGDMSSVEKAWTKDTAAVICEPIQSIGGMNMADASFYQELAAFCKEKGILLIFDEVQTGLGRTTTGAGTFWFAQTVDVQPDIITTAKGIASGLPLACVLIKEKVAAGIQVGEHATTFGGGPLPCAAGLATIETILAPGFMNTVQEKSAHLKAELEKMPNVQTVHGQGLLLGIQLTPSALADTTTSDLVKQALEAGLIIGTSLKKDVVRIMPPLTISQKEIQEFLEIFALLTT